MEHAKVMRDTPEGRADLDACRNVYITSVIHSGANVKEAQSLARHGTPDLTMNVYARTRRERLQALAESVGDTILRGTSTTRAQRKAAGAESLCADDTYMVRAAGLEPATYGLKGRCSTS